MSRVFPLLLLAGAVALSACAPMSAQDGAQPPARSQCFYTDQVDNFRGDNQTLYIRTRNKDVFELQTLGYCADIDFAFGIGFVPDASLSRLCTGDFSRILVSGGPTPRQPCRVQVVKKLTEAEVTALPARDRP
ncbi:MAG: DUF6491 family protein [Candidatus Brevundimonas phytovorans]|nr:DUF6491 family protein [Brevundimonas sp.]WEK58243.1 MAG: DUF6491 family protein [Brevundimonas sp.]